MEEATLKHRTHCENIENVQVKDLIPYEKNPKKHGKNIPELCKAIEKHGWTTPILIDQNNRIIAGHGRRLAAIELNRYSVPCVRMELTDKEYFQIMLEDNRLSAISKVDKKLEREVFELLKGVEEAELDIPGYSLEDIDKLFGVNAKEIIDISGEIDGEVDEDAQVVTMSFKFVKKDRDRIKDVLEAVKKENELESLSEAFILCMSSFKGKTKTIRKTS